MIVCAVLALALHPGAEMPSAVRAQIDLLFSDRQKDRLAAAAGLTEIGPEQVQWLDYARFPCTLYLEQAREQTDESKLTKCRHYNHGIYHLILVLKHLAKQELTPGSRHDGRATARGHLRYLFHGHTEPPYLEEVDNAAVQSDALDALAIDAYRSTLAVIADLSESDARKSSEASAQATRFRWYVDAVCAGIGFSEICNYHHRLYTGGTKPSLRNVDPLAAEDDASAPSEALPSFGMLDALKLFIHDGPPGLGVLRADGGSGGDIRARFVFYDLEHGVSPLCAVEMPDMEAVPADFVSNWRRYVSITPDGCASKGARAKSLVKPK